MRGLSYCVILEPPVKLLMDELSLLSNGSEKNKQMKKMEARFVNLWK